MFKYEVYNAEFKFCFIVTAWTEFEALAIAKKRRVWAPTVKMVALRG